MSGAWGHPHSGADRAQRTVIQAFAASTWHLLASGLKRAHGDFTPEQLNAIVSAYTANNQVYRILDDVDVADFLVDAAAGREDELEPAMIEELIEDIETRTNDDCRLRKLLPGLQRAHMAIVDDG